MPSKYIKDETYQIILSKVIEEQNKKGEIVKDSEVIERLLKRGIAEEKKDGLS